MVNILVEGYRIINWCDKASPLSVHNALEPTPYLNRKYVIYPPSEDRNKVVYSVSGILRDTLRNPRQTAYLLLLELQVAVKYSILELLHKRLLV